MKRQASLLDTFEAGHGLYMSGSMLELDLSEDILRLRPRERARVTVVRFAGRNPESHYQDFWLVVNGVIAATFTDMSVYGTDERGAPQQVEAHVRQIFAAAGLELIGYNEVDLTAAINAIYDPEAPDTDARGETGALEWIIAYAPERLRGAEPNESRAA